MEFGQRTDKGCVRALNEDSLGVRADGTPIAVIADGMGGHNAGEIASSLAVQAVLDTLERRPNINFADIREAVENANACVFSHAVKNENCAGMGTTLVMAVLEKNAVYFANIGDSRGYYFDAETQSLRRVTKDHSLVEELKSAGRLTEEQVPLSPFRNIITRAVGTGEQVSVDLFDIEWKEGDIVLLCSDGLTLHVGERTLRECLANNTLSAQQLCDLLVDLAIESGGHDNISVISIFNDGEVSAR